MSNRFTLTVPYEVESFAGSVRYRSGDLRIRRRQDGTLSLPVVGMNHWHPAARSKTAAKALGRVTRTVDSTDGLWMLVTIDSREAVELVTAYAREPYYGRPIVNAGYMDAIEVGGIETWRGARLRPYRTDPQVDMRPFERVPREWMRH